MKRRKETKRLVVLSLLIAIMVIFSRFISIETEFMKFSFTFLPEMLTGALFGPLWTSVATVAADFIGMWIAPKAQFFPGFTLNALLTGLIYGYFLGKRGVTLKNTIYASLCNTVLIRLLLTPFWLYLMYHLPILPLLGVRLIKQMLTLPIEIALSYLCLTKLPLKRWKKEL